MSHHSQGWNKESMRREEFTQLLIGKIDQVSVDDIKEILCDLFRTISLLKSGQRLFEETCEAHSFCGQIKFIEYECYQKSVC